MYFPFKSAYTYARELYGVELNPDEFETIGLIAWDRIGNRNVRLYKFQAEPRVSDQYSTNYIQDYAYYVDLPCNCDYLEAVTADYEDYQKTTPTTVAGNNQNGWMEGYIETRKYNTNFLYVSGKYIKYFQDGYRLWLSDKFNKVNVFYKGVLVDDEGLPNVTKGELDAIAAFCAYSEKYKKALATNDQVSMQFAQIMKADWEKKCTQARIPEYLNQNEMDEILNVSHSWDRKRFGKSYKPIR